MILPETEPGMVIPGRARLAMPPPATTLTPTSAATARIWTPTGTCEFGTAGPSPNDAENKLTSAAKGGMSASYYRDPLGRICKSVVNGVVTYNVFDGWNVVEYNASGAKIEDTIYGDGSDEIICRTMGNTSYFYQQDALGNVTHVYANGALAESYTYDAYGIVTIRTPSGAVIPNSAIGNRFMFTGREYLSEINLYDYRNRTYSPDLGRFLEPDPLGFAAGDENMYRYVGNNPVNGTDPFGLQNSKPKALDRGGWNIGNYSQATDNGIWQGDGLLVTSEIGAFEYTGPLFSSRSAGLGERRGGEGFDTRTLRSGAEIQDSLNRGSISPVAAVAAQNNLNRLGEAGALIRNTTLAALDIELSVLMALPEAGTRVIFGVVGSSGAKTAAKTAGTGAESALNGLRLNKSLASTAQMGEAGDVMAGVGARVPFRGAGRVAQQYGGNAADWVEKTSSSYTARDGVQFETHWVENIVTGQRVEFKTKFPGGN